MIGLAYMGSCEYLTDLSETSTASGSSCDKLGDGFIYQFSAQGSIGVLYIFVIAIGIQGFHTWRWENHADRFKENSEHQLEVMMQNQAQAPGSISATGTAQAKEQAIINEVLSKTEYFMSTHLRGYLDDYYVTWHGVAGPLEGANLWTM